MSIGEKLYQIRWGLPAALLVFAVIRAIEFFSGAFIGSDKVFVPFAIGAAFVLGILSFDLGWRGLLAELLQALTLGLTVFLAFVSSLNQAPFWMMVFVLIAMAINVLTAAVIRGMVHDL